MSNFTRRDFLKGSAALGVGFVSVGGILVPRNSEAASPLVGIIVTSLLQVITAYLANRSQYKLNSFNEQYQPFDRMTQNYSNLGYLTGNVAQNTLHSGRINNPINHFAYNEEGMQFRLNRGNLYMGREGGDFAKIDPAEANIIRKHYHETGEHLMPTEHKITGYYSIPTKYQRDEIREKSKDHPELAGLELGEGFHLQGTRKMVSDSGKESYMSKMSLTYDKPKNLKTYMYLEG